MPPNPAPRTSPSHARRTTLAVGALLCSAQAIMAQQEVRQTPWRPATGAPPGFHRLDQTVEDVSPLRVSFRVLSPDLRVPTGFRDVYRIEGSGAQASRLGIYNPSGADLLARVDGAVTAVFPQSVYVNLGNGPLALVPPGTIFFIGRLPFGAALPSPAPAPNAAAKPVDQRAETVMPPAFRPVRQVAQPARGVPDVTPPETPIEEAKPSSALRQQSIMTDEEFRRERVRDLILRAAGIGEGDAAPAPPPAANAAAVSPVTDKPQAK